MYFQISLEDFQDVEMCDFLLKKSENMSHVFLALKKF